MTAGPLNVDQEKSMRALVGKTAQLGVVIAAVFDKACFRRVMWLRAMDCLA
jgi:hypothetical protein